MDLVDLGCNLVSYIVEDSPCCPVDVQLYTRSHRSFETMLYLGVCNWIDLCLIWLFVLAKGVAFISDMGSSLSQQVASHLRVTFGS